MKLSFLQLYFILICMLNVYNIQNSPVSVTNGGTGLSSMTTYAILTSGSTDYANLVSIGTGTSGQVLILTKPSAAPSFQNNNYGITLLQTLTASSSASLTLTNTDFSSSYNVFLIELDNIESSAVSAIFQALFSTDNGSSYIVTNYLCALNTFTYNSASWSQTTTTTYIPLSLSSGGAVSYVSGFLYFFPRIANFASGAGRFSFMNGIVIPDYNGTMAQVLGWNTGISTVPVNNIKFQFSTGNIAKGVIRLYGLKPS